MPNPQDIFQLAQQTATQVTASPENWRRFLYTAAHNYHTTYLNQLLIHAQRPDATACATMKYWNEQAHRKVMYGSKSIIILQRHQGVPTAKRVFSMTDTVLTGDKAAAPWEVTDAIRPLLMQVNSVGSLMDRATEQVVSLSDRANRVLATSIEDSALNCKFNRGQYTGLEPPGRSAVHLAGSCCTKHPVHDLHPFGYPGAGRRFSGFPECHPV